MTPTPLPIHPHTMGDTWHPDERAAIISYGDERAKVALAARVPERWLVETNGTEAHIFLDGKQVATFDKNKNPSHEAMYEFFEALQPASADEA